MNKLYLTTAFILIFFQYTVSQNNVFAFYEYDIIKGMHQEFIDGYHKDLEWQASQNDNWSWVGWFVLNGERRGRFVDATPNHSWIDFDNWVVDSKENVKHNNENWIPYVENPSGSYQKVMESFSRYEADWFKASMLQVYTIKVAPGKEYLFHEFLNEFKSVLKSNIIEGDFVWMKMVSGGSVHQYCLYISIDKVGDVQMCESLFDFSISKKMRSNYTESVISNVSELWKYSEFLSQFPE